MKACSKCRIEKDEKHFSKCAKVKCGLRSECKECEKQFRHLNKQKIKEKRLGYFKKYYINNKNDILKKQKDNYACNKEHRKQIVDKYQKKNPDKIKSQKQKTHEKAKNILSNWYVLNLGSIRKIPMFKNFLSKNADALEAKKIILKIKRHVNEKTNH